MKRIAAIRKVASQPLADIQPSAFIGVYRRPNGCFRVIKVKE